MEISYKAEEGDIYIDGSIHEWLCGATEQSPFKDKPILKYSKKLHI
jgi:hypothetical protein